MIELRRVRGPLNDEPLDWISRLYGPVDAKYGSLDYLRHQFVENPFGWSAHVFAVADKRAVGHCGVVPFRARRGGESLTFGKLEGLAVDPAHRGRRDDGGSVATDILRALYAFAHEQGLAVLFGLAPPAVAKIHVRAGCRTVPSEAPAFVHVTTVRAFARGASRRRRIAATGLSVAQRAMLAVASGRPVRLSEPTEEDGALVAAEAGDTAWTVSGADAWDWYRGSGVLKALEVPGHFGSRAIVRFDESQEATLQIVAWRPYRAGLLPGALLLSAAARIAREASAPTVRFQPWPGAGGNGALARTCRAFGFVKRAEADLLLHTDGVASSEYDQVRLTPFFYVTF